MPSDPLNRTPLKEVKPGAVLDHPVFYQGRTLYSQGKTLQQDELRKLEELRIDSVVLRESPLSIKEPNIQSDPLSSEFRELAVNTIRRIYEDFQHFDDKDASQVNLISSRLYEEVRSASKLGIAVHDLRDYSDYTYRHSVNVTAISVAIGIRMGLDEEQLTDLTIGGLLHDIGKMKVPNEILDKNGPLTPQEIRIVRRHPEWGWDILKERTGFSPLVWSIARQHHETMEGGGYPDGLKGFNIHEISRIVAVVDVYDALRSERPYKPSWHPDKILTFFTDPQVLAKYDPEIVEIFSDLIVPYPIGSRVMITGGKVGVVAGLNIGDFSRPIVRLEKASRDAYMDLTEHKGLEVIQTLELGNQAEIGAV